MAPRSSRNWEGRGVEDDIETVRSLNDWSPTPRHTPPTSRLMLNLDGVSNGPAYKPGQVAANNSTLKPVAEATNSSGASNKNSTVYHSIKNDLKQSNANSSGSGSKSNSSGNDNHNELRSDNFQSNTTNLESGNKHQSQNSSTSRSNPTTKITKQLRASKQLPKYLLDKLQAKSSQVRKVFRSMDKDKDGKVQPRELQHAMADWGIHLSDLDLQNIVKIVDADHSGFIQFQEFCDAFFPPNAQEGVGVQALAPSEKVRAKAKPEGANKGHSTKEIFVDLDTFDHSARKRKVAAQRSARRRERQAMLKSVPEFVIDKIQAKAGSVSKVFLHMDEDKNGKLSAREFQRGMAEMGIVLSDKDLVSIMRVVDVDKSGSITLQEFSDSFLGGKDYSGYNIGEQQQARGLRIHKETSHPDDVIVKEIKRSELLEPVEKEELGIQLKIIDPMLAKCNNANAFARNMLKLYRSCEPDEFGFIDESKFLNVLENKYGVKQEEGKKLFQLGVDNKPQVGEMNYHQFRKALTRVDGDVADLYPTKAPRPKIRINEAMAKSTTKIGTRPKNFTQMAPEERDEFRQRNRILRLIEENKNQLRDRFLERRQFGKYNTNIKTRISYEKLTKAINELGVETGLDTVRRLYAGSNTHRDDDETARSPRHHRKDSITFSQLCRRTADYFARLDAGEDYRELTRKELNTQLKGQNLGCRAQGTGAAAKNQTSSNPSSFWTHHDIPKRRKKRRDQRKATKQQTQTGSNNNESCETDRSDTSSFCSTSRSYASSYLPEITSRTFISTSRMEDDEYLDTERRERIAREHLWRSRWTEKTFKRKKKGGFGGNRRANGPLSQKMYEGNGNITAIAEEPVLPQVLATGRSYVSTSPFAVDDTRYF